MPLGLAWLHPSEVQNCVGLVDWTYTDFGAVPSCYSTQSKQSSGDLWY